MFAQHGTATATLRGHHHCDRPRDSPCANVLKNIRTADILGNQYSASNHRVRSLRSEGPNHKLAPRAVFRIAIVSIFLITLQISGVMSVVTDGCVERGTHPHPMTRSATVTGGNTAAHDHHSNQSPGHEKFSCTALCLLACASCSMATTYQQPALGYMTQQRWTSAAQQHDSLTPPLDRYRPPISAAS